MKLLNQILPENLLLQVSKVSDMAIEGLAIDSRKVAPGYIYFAVPGTQVDGHDYIPQAEAAGAVIIIGEKNDVQLNTASYIQVDRVNDYIGTIAAAFYNNPSQKMKVIGVTGTNGKTTVTTLLYKLFEQLGYHCGLISTVQNIIGNTVEISTHTTPDAISIQSLLHRMQEAGCEYVFMEVSSHAVHQQRILGIQYAGAVFTNITHDHLDYHKTFDEYIKVKKRFFDQLPKTAFALTNIDDKRGTVMLQNTAAAKYSYALKQMADYKAKVLENQLHGLLLSIDNMEVHFRIAGLFNAYNILAVLGVAHLLGEDKAEVLSILSNIHGAEGRFETYRSPSEGVIGIIDYAHTPDALLNVLATIKQFESRRNIITVVGCGGDRDKAKRPLMTTVACEHSDQVILTSDNPRSENPETILDEMQEGISAAYSRKILRIVDRKQAIRTAVMMAQPNDVILVAGKGHEKYQEINGVKYPFDDVEILLNQYKELDK